ncbi:2-dehydro-3-deoxy-6-phosphogalactonate aldolase [Acerihabitans sp. KWT182]|uniref:2-dehydro-3-deoxy-6-phosphogalactonate aldolase n=1 Tax=Acerihabitans sp. KWT182 TaxID=3157919 RepID=A0AAU7QBK4_9GAMM
MNWLDELPLVAILRGITPQEIAGHLEALINEGFQAIEIPTNSPDWQQSIALAVAQAQGRAAVGAGTVLTTAMAETVARLGGALIVTPNVNPATIAAARRADLQVCSGFFTASEAFAALEAGAQVLKLFPAGAVTGQYLKALKAVLPSEAPVLSVGGVTPETLGYWLDAGCKGAGLGSDLYKPGQRVEQTRDQARRFVQAYRAWRDNK